MGKKARRRAAELEAARPAVAERHGFEAGGLLGHDGTYSVNVTEQVALAVDVVFACIRTLCWQIGDAKVGEYRGNELLPPSRLTLRPMASMTVRQWLWLVTATMALYTGTYLQRLGRDSEGVPLSLRPLAPPRVNWTGPRTVHVDGDEVDPDDLVWLPLLMFPTLSRDTAWLIRLAREAISAAWAADSYRADFWSNGGSPPYYLTSDQPLSGDDAVAIGDRWAERRTLNPGRPPVLGKGANVKELGANLGDAGASEATSKVGAAIARYFGVPSWLVNVPTEAGSLVYANSSSAGLDLVRYTLQPGYAGPIGDALSEELPGGYLTGRRVVLDLNHLTRGNRLEEARAYEIATGRRPWLLPSEVRADLHLPMDMTLDEQGAPAPALEQIPGGV